MLVTRTNPITVLFFTTHPHGELAPPVVGCPIVAILLVAAAAHACCRPRTCSCRSHHPTPPPTGLRLTIPPEWCASFAIHTTRVPSAILSRRVHYLVRERLWAWSNYVELIALFRPARPSRAGRG